MSSLLAFGCLALAVTELGAASAGLFLEEVVKDGRSRRPADFGALLDTVRRAHHVNPLSADHLATLARLHAWQAWQQPAARDAAAYRRASVVRFRQTVRRRPTWGSAWAELAEGSALVQGYSAEARHALRRAARLGPFEPGVQTKVVWLGVLAWPSLSSEERALVRAAAERARRIGTDLRAVARLARQHDPGAAAELGLSVGARASARP